MVVVEVIFGITVTATLLLPKSIESKGAKLKSLFSSLRRPLTSFTSKDFSESSRNRTSTTAPLKKCLSIQSVSLGIQRAVYLLPTQNKI